MIMLHCNKTLPPTDFAGYQEGWRPDPSLRPLDREARRAPSETDDMPLNLLQSQFGATVQGMNRVYEAMGEIARLSPMVIALRTDVALHALADPTSVPAGEPIRMVAEKLDAVAQSAMAATLEAGLAVGRGLSERRLPLDAGFSIATAALGPIRDRLRDNVRRLGATRIAAE